MGDVAPSLYCTVISIDSPHMRKDGANYLKFLLNQYGTNVDMNLRGVVG